MTACRVSGSAVLYSHANPYRPSCAGLSGLCRGFRDPVVTPLCLRGLYRVGVIDSSVTAGRGLSVSASHATQRESDEASSLSMARLQAVYYRDSEGLEPVNQFIDALDPKAQEALDWHISLLNDLDEDDPPLAFPHSSQVDGDLRELRCHYGRRLFRVLYRRSEKLFVLLHAFEKRTAKVPASEIRIAQQRWDDFKTRMAEQLDGDHERQGTTPHSLMVSFLVP